MSRLANEVLQKIFVVRRAAFAPGALALALVSAGCGNGVEVSPEPPRVQPPPLPLSPALVSEPQALVSPQEGAAFVSASPGAFPTGQLATIRNAANGRQEVVPMVDGGWDPISIAAESGDTIRISITTEQDGTLEYANPVPPIYRPVIVRTDPPPRKRDVPLNAVMLVVFSEPIDPATVTSQHVQLLRDQQPLDAGIELSADGLRMTVRSQGLLAPATEYVLVISPELRDLTGNRLATGTEVEFTTGTAAQLTAGVYDLTALITRFDPAWGDLTGYSYTATLRINEGPPQFRGTFADLRFVGPGGEFEVVANTGNVEYYIELGQVVLDLVKAGTAQNSGFTLTLVVAAAAPARIEGNFGAGGHIGGPFTALRRNDQ